MVNITDKQRVEWLKQNRCHVCGSGVDNHTHPNWMWLSNPPPKIKGKVSEEVKERVDLENAIIQLQLKALIG